MKVLIVSAFKEHLADHAAPFVVEQKNALQLGGVECDSFFVRGKGVRGYLNQLRPLKEKVAAFHPDVIHAHYGLSGLLANLQRTIPVVTTYHGSDINDPKALRFSKMAMRLSAWNIFVSKKTMETAGLKDKCSLLPCGIDLSDLQLTSRTEARRQMHLDQEKRYIIFAGAFDNPVKNAPLAFEAVQLISSSVDQLLELKGYTREEVNLLLCAADALLLTSFNEGSPQVIKEAMACGCPIVSVDVGDVKERVEGVEGCFVAKSREPEVLADLLREAIQVESRTQGREKIIADGLDNNKVAEVLLALYEKVCAR